MYNTYKEDIIYTKYYTNTCGFRRQSAEVGWYSERRSPSSDISVSRRVIADICRRETGHQDTVTFTTCFLQFYFTSEGTQTFSKRLQNV